MTIQFHNGTLLFGDNGLAMSPECCCPVSCGAPWITGLFNTAEWKGPVACGPYNDYGQECRMDLAWNSVIAIRNAAWCPCGWISKSCDQTLDADDPALSAEIEDYDFELTFCVDDQIDPNDIYLGGWYLADNYLMDLTLNGTSGTTDKGGPGDSRFSCPPGPWRFDFPSSAIQTGANKVIFTVRNDSFPNIHSTSPMGLCVVWDCCLYTENEGTWPGGGGGGGGGGGSGEPEPPPEEEPLPPGP